MIDMHSHILYGIDDGSRTREESVELLKYLEKQGVTESIVTPHYIDDTQFVASIEKRKELIRDLQTETNIKLYIGNEVYFSDKTIESLNSKKLSTLNDSKYILIEFPLSNRIKDVDEMVYDLSTNGVIPIIAHPERYLYVQEDYKYLDKLVEVGALFQVNYGSIIGIYGSKAEKTAKTLLKKGYISFLGSDIHRIDKPIDLEKAMKKLKKIVKKQEIVDDLTYNNIKKIINNESL